MTDIINPNVIGYAAYFEFRKGPQTWQIIVTPTVAIDAAASVPASMFRRRLTPSAPRKMWKQVAAAGLHSGYVPPSATPVDRIDFIRPMFDSLVTNQWKIHRQPIIVEMTKEDALEVRQGKVPYKVIGRVLKSRKVLKFFPKLFGEFTEATAI